MRFDKTLNDYKILNKFASEDNDGSTFVANADYNSSAATFTLRPATNETYFIEKLIIHLSDAAAFTLDQYGATGGALSNGYNITVTSKKFGVYNIFPENIKTNNNLERHGRGSLKTTYASSNDSLTVEIDLSGLKLHGGLSESIDIALSDDLSGLTDHTFLFRGLIKIIDI